MMKGNINNKLFETQQMLNKAKDTVLQAQKLSMSSAESLLTKYEGPKKEMLLKEMANLRSAMKSADANELNNISERMIEILKKCQ